MSASKRIKQKRERGNKVYSTVARDCDTHRGSVSPHMTQDIVTHVQQFIIGNIG